MIRFIATAAAVILTAGAHSASPPPGETLSFSDGYAHTDKGLAKYLAAVQSAPDPNLRPNFGSVSLQAGFSPEPHVIDVLAGGDISVNRAMSGRSIGRAGDQRCRGHISPTPDFRLHYDADGRALTIATTARFDTTLVVHGPDGTWYCDDDSGPGSLSQLRWDTPQSGQYNIWVGVFSSSFMAEQASIVISEHGGTGGVAAAPLSEDIISLDRTQTPVHGVISLTAGFSPDPRVVQVRSRGQVSMANSLRWISVGRVGDRRCRGETGAAPDLSVQYTAGRGRPLAVRAFADYNSALVVLGPDGTWYCDDNSGQGRNPALVFNQPASGRYDIWFGNNASTLEGWRGRIEISSQP